MCVKCAVSRRDGIEDLHTEERFFSHPQELEDALKDAGVSEEEARAPYHVLNNGLPTFIPVNVEIARRLGMLP